VDWDPGATPGLYNRFYLAANLAIGASCGALSKVIPCTRIETALLDLI
jgi:hypothetical protein